jgi:hypothetical protein
MLPGQPAVISNSTWFIYGQIARAVSVVAGVIASIVAGVKPSKPKPVATKAAVAKTFLPETAPVKAPGVKAAATETAAMGLGSSSGDHGSKGNHNYGCVFNNLRVMRPSFSLPSPDSLSHPRHV